MTEREDYYLPWDQWDQEDDDGFYDDDYEEDPFEEAIGNCGQVPGGGCTMVGTEYCDWECPFSHELWKAAIPRDEKGRFTRRS